MEDDRIFLTCEKCGKRLIERMPNGLFRFIFGKKKDSMGKLLDFTPVYILIHGSVKIRCLTRTCGYFNTFNYFPKSPFESGPPEPVQRQTATIKN
jgi:hypothetical protein